MLTGVLLRLSFEASHAITCPPFHHSLLPQQKTPSVQINAQTADFFLLLSECEGGDYLADNTNIGLARKFEADTLLA